MGKNKLKKFADMEGYSFVFQYPFAALKEHGFPYRGKWHEFFGNSNPIVLELGCGKGEYTVGLAKRFPDKNFIGVDIKGARMWTGAKEADTLGMDNVAFLRTDIELLDNFFAPGEVSEIWITFPDPQMKKVRKRLTSTRFLQLYRKVTANGAKLRLKTDSPFLYTYTRTMALENKLPLLADISNLYALSTTDMPHMADKLADLQGIRTFYEQQWLDRGLTIKYIEFAIPDTDTLVEPDVEIPMDTYRSFSRGYIQMPQLMEQSHTEQP